MLPFLVLKYLLCVVEMMVRVDDICYCHVLTSQGETALLEHAVRGGRSYQLWTLRA